MAVKLAVQSTFSDKGTRKAKDSVTSLDKHAKASFKRIAGYIAGAFAFTKIVGFVKSAIGAYFEQEKAVEGLRQALASTNEATEENMAQLQKVASALQVVTRVGDETTLALMTVGKSMGINTDNLDEAATAAIVFNKRFGIDMNTAMRGLALAFQGNTQQLSRYIPELRGVTDANQAYNMIMKTSTQLLREQAELGMTNAERAKAIQAAWGDLTEEFGAFIIESGLAEDVMDTLLFAIEDIQEVGFAKWFEDTFPALDGFIDRIVSLLKHLGILKDYVEEEWMSPKSTEEKVSDIIGTPFEGETEADIASRMGKGKPSAVALERQSYADAAKVMQQLEAGAITLEQAIEQMPKNITIDVEKIPKIDAPVVDPVSVEMPDAPVVDPVSVEMPDAPVVDPVSVEMPDAPVVDPVSVEMPDAPVVDPVSVEMPDAPVVNPVSVEMPDAPVVDPVSVEKPTIPDIEISNIREFFIAMQRGTLKIEEAAEKFPDFIQIGEAPTLPKDEEQPELMGPPTPSARDLERAGRRDERRRRREEREAQASQLLDQLRGGLGAMGEDTEGGAVTSGAGGQRLGVGELFERAFGMQAQKKEPTGTAGDPVHIILMNPEDVATGLA